MKENKDPDPFSPLFEHEIHAERLSREWEESQHSFTFANRFKVQLTAFTRAVVSKAVKFLYLGKFLKARRLAKVKIK